MKTKKNTSKQKKKKKDLLKTFKELLIKEKETLNQSQKHFYNSPQVKVGQR
jgi:hypothetical protein